MRGSYRFKRSVCHAKIDVSVSVVCQPSASFAVEIDAAVREHISDIACEGIEVGLSRVEQTHGNIAVRVVQVIDHSGESTQLAYATAAQAAAHVALGRPDLAPPLYPGLVP
jgi:hypothetical protein